MILSETRLSIQPEVGVLKKLARYVEASNKVRKQHGMLRLILEFARFLQKRGLEE